MFAPRITDHDDLVASPMDPTWVVSGDPQPRVKHLASTGPRTQVALWDCTAGAFDWRFGPFDETVHVLEGSVRVALVDGSERVLGPGDVALFPAGSTSRWVVEDYVRKLAVLHDTRSRVRRLVDSLR